MVKSNLFRAVRLDLFDKYNLSDKEVQSVVEVFTSKGLGNTLDSGSVLHLLHVLDFFGVDLPCSYSLFKSLWTKSVTTFDFDLEVRNLVKDGFIVIRKTTNSVFWRTDSISKDRNDFSGENVYQVVYGTSVFKEIRGKLRELGLSKKIRTVHLVDKSSSIDNLDDFHRRFIIRLRDNLQLRFSAFLELESYVYNYDLGVDEISINIHADSSNRWGVDIDLLDKVVKQSLLIDDGLVVYVDAYFDPNGSIFMSLGLKSSLVEDLIKIGNRIETVVSKLYDGELVSELLESGASKKYVKLFNYIRKKTRVGVDIEFESYDRDALKREDTIIFTLKFYDISVDMNEHNLRLKVKKFVKTNAEVVVYKDSHNEVSFEIIVSSDISSSEITSLGVSLTTAIGEIH